MQSFLCSGKHFFLTGCASGIGKHLCGVLAERGATIIASDINIDGLRSAAKEDSWPLERVSLHQLDVSNVAHWESILAGIPAAKPIDVLLNIAGYLKPGYVVEQATEEFRRHVDINVIGLMIGCSVVGKHMAAKGSGHIVNFGSLGGVAPIPGIAVYSATKYAVRGFSLALAQELKPYGVAVTVLCPDAVKTPMLDLQTKYKEAALTFSGSSPLSVEDIERVLLEVVLPKRPRELLLPFSRGILAKTVNSFPGLMDLSVGMLTKKGLKNQRRFLG